MYAWPGSLEEIFASLEFMMKFRDHDLIFGFTFAWKKVGLRFQLRRLGFIINVAIKKLGAVFSPFTVNFD